MCGSVDVYGMGLSSISSRTPWTGMCYGHYYQSADPSTLPCGSGHGIVEGELSLAECLMGWVSSIIFGGNQAQAPWWAVHRGKPELAKCYLPHEVVIGLFPSNGSALESFGGCTYLSRARHLQTPYFDMVVMCRMATTSPKVSM